MQLYLVFQSNLFSGRSYKELWKESVAIYLKDFKKGVPSLGSNKMKKSGKEIVCTVHKDNDLKWDLNHWCIRSGHDCLCLKYDTVIYLKIPLIPQERLNQRRIVVTWDHFIVYRKIKPLQYKQYVINLWKQTYRKRQKSPSETVERVGPSIFWCIPVPFRIHLSMLQCMFCFLCCDDSKGKKGHDTQFSTSKNITCITRLASLLNFNPVLMWSSLKGLN